MRKYTDEERKQREIERGYNTYKKNLVPINERDPQEALEIRRKAQRAMVESKKRKKNIKDICNDLLSIPATDLANNVVSPELKEKIAQAGIEVTLYDLIMAKQAENALNGSTKSAEFIRDSAGDKPSDKVEETLNIITDSDKALLANISDRLDSLEAQETTAKEIE